MASSVKAWWTRDTALHSFVFIQFLINMPFSVFNTYVIYQLQVVGFLVGTDNEGLPCTGTYCIVPWAGMRLDLNSVLLYLNALSFGLGGAVTLFLCAYSDFWCESIFLKAVQEMERLLMDGQRGSTFWSHSSSSATERFRYPHIGCRVLRSTNFKR